MTQTQVWTIGKLLEWTTDFLKKNGSESPRLDAEVLLAHARSCQRIQLYTAFLEEPDESIKASFRTMVKKRSEGTPVAYLVGYKEFYSLTFRVSPAVLIPRSETEHVVVEAIDWLKQLRKLQPNAPAAKVIDVCTGSGCIAVSIAKHAPDAIVQAVDISPEALEIAKLNVEQLGVADRVQLVQSDLLDGLSDLQEVDLIVSNPPYITESEYAALAKSVREYEPKIALVAGADGLDVINRLLAQSHAKLRVGGCLIFEISPMLADKVRELVERDAGWKLDKIVKDLAGHSRVVVARKVA